MADPLWPFFDLAVTSGPIELRYPDDETAAALADLALAGIHDPSWMPFGHPWTDGEPDVVGRGSMQHHWKARGSLAPAKWDLPFAVFSGGELAGVQGLHARNFPRLGSVETGSWLGRPFQGQGIGKQMRRLALHLIFEGLGAVEATSGAWEDNTPSLAVSRALGYQNNGDGWDLRRNEPARMMRLRMDRAGWETARADGSDVVVAGLDACLPLLGVTATS